MANNTITRWNDLWPFVFWLQVSENLQEEDEEEAQIERNIDEIDEQM